MNLPICIDEIDWERLSQQISKVHSMTPAQREKYFYNTRSTLPPQSLELGNALFALTRSFCYCKEFHEYTGLRYDDPKRTNGQIIRVALIGLLERAVNQGEAIILGD